MPPSCPPASAATPDLSAPTNQDQTQGHPKNSQAGGYSRSLDPESPPSATIITIYGSLRQSAFRPHSSPQAPIKTCVLTHRHLRHKHATRNTPFLLLIVRYSPGTTRHTPYTHYPTTGTRLVLPGAEGNKRWIVKKRFLIFNIPTYESDTHLFF